MAERKTQDAPEGFTYLENSNSPESAGFYANDVADVLLLTAVDGAWHTPARAPLDIPPPSIDGIPSAAPIEGN